MVASNARLQGKDEEKSQKKGRKPRLKKTLTKQQREAERLIYEEKVTGNKLARRTGEILKNPRELSRHYDSPHSQQASENNSAELLNELKTIRQKENHLREVREELVVLQENKKKIADIAKSASRMDSITQKNDLKEIVENTTVPDTLKDPIKDEITKRILLTGRKNEKTKKSLQRQRAEKMPKEEAVKETIQQQNQGHER